MIRQKSLFVKSIFPDRGSSNIPLDQIIEIFFSLPLDILSINLNTIVVAENSIRPISGSIKYDAINYSVRFIPDELLNPETTYQITIVGGPDGIRDALKAAYLPSNFTSTFKTEKSFFQPPVLITPNDQSSVYETPIFKWERVGDVEPSYYQIQVSKMNNFVEIIWPIENINIYGTEVTPDIIFEPGMYYWRVRSVKSGRNSPWSLVYRFRVVSPEVPDTLPSEGEEGEEEEEEEIIGKFKVLKTFPKDDEIRVKVDIESIKIEFNSIIDEDTVSLSNIGVVGTSFDGDVNIDDEYPTFSGFISSGAIVSYYLSGYLTKDFSYRVTVKSNSIRNVYNLALEKDYIFTFHTIWTYYYVSSKQIRTNIGSLVEDWTDMEIDRVIYDVSKYAYIMASDVIKSELDRGIINKDVRCFVEWETISRILNNKLISMSVSTQQVTLADFSIRSTTPDANFVRLLIDNAKSKADRCLSRITDEVLGDWVSEQQYALRDKSIEIIDRRI